MHSEELVIGNVKHDATKPIVVKIEWYMVNQKPLVSGILPVTGLNMGCVKLC